MPTHPVATFKPFHVALILLAFMAVLGVSTAKAQTGASEPLPPELPGPKPDNAQANLQPLPTTGSNDASFSAQIGELDVDAGGNVPLDPSLFEPLSVSLSALLTPGGPRLENGVVWRIYDDGLDGSRQLNLVAKSNDASPVIDLVPGGYVVHVSYGHAQISQNIDVVPDQVNKQIILDIGGLSLNATVADDIPIPFNQLSFDLFTSSPQTGERVPIARDIRANTLLHLNAGTYHVVSSYGNTNAKVRADIRVESSRLVDATLIHRAAEVTFKLVSNLGGDAIADVYWIIKNRDGETVFEDRSAFPRAVLEEGEYVLIVRSADQIYNRNIQVTSGAPREMEILARY